MGLSFEVRSSGCFKMGSFLWMNLSFSKKVHNIRVRSNMVLRFHNTHRKESLFC